MADTTTETGEHNPQPCGDLAPQLEAIETARAELADAEKRLAAVQGAHDQLQEKCAELQQRAALDQEAADKARDKRVAALVEGRKAPAAPKPSGAAYELQEAQADLAALGERLQAAQESVAEREHAVADAEDEHMRALERAAWAEVNAACDELAPLVQRAVVTHRKRAGNRPQQVEGLDLSKAKIFEGGPAGMELHVLIPRP